MSMGGVEYVSFVRIFALGDAAARRHVARWRAVRSPHHDVAPMSFALSFTHAVAPTTSGLRRGTHAMRRVRRAASRVGAMRARWSDARARARRRRACARIANGAPGARDGAPGGAVARVGMVEKNSLRRHARVLARDVRRRGRDERMRD